MKSKNFQFFGSKNKKGFLKKTTIFIVILILLLASIVYNLIAVKIEYNKNEIFKNDFNKKDFNGMYSFFVLNNPIIKNRPVIGEETAPISLIVVIDFQSELGKTFYYEKIPIINELYIEPGHAKLYYKYHLSEDEYREKKGRFIYASAVNCYTAMKGKELDEFHKALYGTAEQDIILLSESFSIPKTEFNECLEQNSFETLIQDMTETKIFRIQGPSIQIGLDGRDNTVLFGNPSIAQINRTIRLKQIRIGI